MLVSVGSLNPVKLEAAKALSHYGEFTYQTVSVPSGVSNQPMTEDETLTGAINRAKLARVTQPWAEIGLGLEGGCKIIDDTLWAYAYCAIHKNSRISYAKTSEFRLPPRVHDLVNQGLEVGEAMDHLFGTHNVKQKEGASGILTNGGVTRIDMYRPAVLYAYIPFSLPDLYF